ncbi:MAG TPA: right-handed parallel beta-helix repeat-containing protein [Phenylobacterium sp.]|nr:right-handed parallel beta-helix repeat-containing protein [Phenylobacterium sp.]
MTTYTVSNTVELSTALKSAVGGDTISLAGGNYGDVAINKAFSSDVLITSQSAGSPAVFHTLNLGSAANVHIDAVKVDFTPSSTTYAFSPAVSISYATNITITHSTITGGLAVNGVSPDSTTLDNTQNVLGFPTGYGVSIGNSNNVKLDGVEISTVNKGIVLNNSNYVTVAHSDIHDLRTSGIVGGGGSHITIDSNHIHDSNPWHWGYGDHADYLALWTNAGQASASTDIKITNNLMEQGKGTALLGMWLQGGAVGFSGVTISGNAFLNGNFQGITLWDTSNASVDHNTLLQTSGDTKARPSILLSSGTHNVTVSDNTLGAYNDQSGSTGALANTATNNTLVQRWDPSAAGYYTDTLITSTEQAYSIDGLYGVNATGQVVSSTPVVSDPVVTDPVVSDPVVVDSSTPVASDPVTAPAPTPPANLVINGTWDYAKLVGGDGNDTITSKSGGDTLVGGAGDDTYVFTASKTLVVENAGGGVDTVIAKGDYTLTDNVENLTVSSAASNNWSGTGNGLDNVITGNAGNNYLRGLAGNDTISGGLGNDIVVGGAGSDRLTGGAGKDTFRFERGSGNDVVTDFNKVDHDVIDVSAYLKAGYKAVLTDVGTDVKISFATGDSIILTGIHAKDLSATGTGFTL